MHATLYLRGNCNITNLHVCSSFYLFYLKITFDNSFAFTSLHKTPLAHALCERERPQTPPSHREARAGRARDYWTIYVQNVRTSSDLVSSIPTWISGFQSGFLDFRLDFRISEWISGFQSGFLDFKVDFWISEWISGFQSGFLDFWISDWISGFQIGFPPTVYEISLVTDPSIYTSCRVQFDGI